MLRPGRTVDSCPKDHPPILAQVQGPYRERDEKTFFLSGYLTSFGHAWALSIHLSSFWPTQCKNLPLCHLGKWGRLPSVPDYLGSGKEWAAGPVIRKSGDTTAFGPPPDIEQSARKSREASWSLWVTSGSSAQPTWPAPLKWPVRPGLHLTTA